jgi:valyl-tRNA synthetase
MIKGGNALIIELGDYVDMEAEKAKLKEELNKLTGEIKRCEGMLSNPNFTSKAPAAKVEAERTKLADYQSKYDAIKEKLENM